MRARPVALSRDSQAGQRIDGGRFTSGIGGANGLIRWGSRASLLRPWARDPRARPVKDRPRSPSPVDGFPRAVPAGRDRRERRRAKALSGSARRCGHSLRGGRRSRGSAQFSRLGRHRQKGRMAEVVADGGHDSPHADLCALRGRPGGGIDNPLGARALYLYRGNQDTYFRLHGTNEPETIG